jgi:hypothetical protein
LGVNGGVGSAGAGAETIGVVEVGVVRVGAEVGMATAEEIGKTGTGSIVRIFRGFEVGARSFGKS